MSSCGNALPEVLGLHAMACKHVSGKSNAQMPCMLPTEEAVEEDDGNVFGSDSDLQPMLSSIGACLPCISLCTMKQCRGTMHAACR